MRVVTIEPTFASFRDAARALLDEGVRPELVTWDDGERQQPSLFDASVPSAPGRRTTARVPAAFLARAEIAALHSDPSRWDVLYRLAFRLTHGEPGLLDDAADPDVVRLAELASAVRRDEHRMHAFVRFRRVEDEDGEAFVAWYEPEHDVLALGGEHFARRYPNMRWAILSSRRSIAWDGRALEVGPGAPRVRAPEGDGLEELFRSYYASIFSPARTNLALFEKHVPSRFRAEMPETAVVAELVRDAPERTRAMAAKKTSPSLAFVPPHADRDELARAAQACRACDLYARATQAVFGEGSTSASLVLVGEQPGDQEDIQGHPFVGPAGRVLDEALERAGIPRREVYVTNAVKHFKFEQRGKRRLHSKPNPVEVHACRGWLETELALIQPEVVVCLGATAAQALLGRTFKVTQQRGQIVDASPFAAQAVATWHPSAILRADKTDGSMERMREELVSDLTLAARTAGIGAHARKRRAVRVL